MESERKKNKRQNLGFVYEGKGLEDATEEKVIIKEFSQNLSLLFTTSQKKVF